MDTFSWPRQAGKTTELIRLSCKNDIPILVLNNAHKRVTLSIAEKMGMFPTVLTINEIAPTRCKVYIDNAELMLESLLKVEVEWLAFTSTNHKKLAVSTIEEWQKVATNKFEYIP